MLPFLFLLLGDMTDNYTDSSQLGSCNFNCNECLEMGVYEGECGCTIDPSGNQSLAETCPFYDTYFPVDELFQEEYLRQECFNPLVTPNRTACLEYTKDFFADQFLKQQIDICNKYAIAGVIVLVLGAIHAGTFSYISRCISKDLRKTFFKSLLRQEVGFYDKNLPSELNSRLNDDIYFVKSGINDKVSSLFQFLVQGIIAITIGFTKSWKLAGMIILFSPLFMIFFGLIFFSIGKLTKRRQENYEKCGSIAEEVITNIKTVQSFSGQKAEVARYTKYAIEAGKKGAVAGYYVGASVGLLYFSIFLLYGASFTFGTYLYIIRDLSAGGILTTFFNVLIGAFSIAQATVNLQAFLEATAAYKRLFAIIDRE